MTRPLGAAERFVAGLPDELRARLNPVYSPLIGIEAIAGEIDFADARGIIFTSSNGVAIAACLTRQRNLPCYCVGKATRDAARRAGWRAENTGRDAAGLISSLLRQAPAGPLLHLRGRQARGDVAARLTAQGLPVREQVIYDQPLRELNDLALRAMAMKSPVIVPLFSPRTARQFANLVTGQAPLFLAALSSAVAEPLKSLVYNRLVISSQPDAKGMAQAVAMLTNNAKRVEGARPAQ